MKKNWSWIDLLGIAVIVIAIVWGIFVLASCNRPVQQSTPAAPTQSTTQETNVQLNSPQTVPQQHTVALSWTWNSNFQNFKVYRSKTSGIGYVLRGTVAKKGYVDTVPNATNGEVFYYVVTATVNGKETPYSNQQQAVMP